MSLPRVGRATDSRFHLNGGLCLQQTDLGPSDAASHHGTGRKQRFVLSLFAVGDDIKAHWKKDTATFCGATWPQFFDSAEVSEEDIWAGVDEDARTLWTVRFHDVPTAACRHRHFPRPWP